MRYILFNLFLLASLPVATAQVLPVAQYDPATGDVVLRNLRGLLFLTLWSDGKFLDLSLLAQAPPHFPPEATPPMITTRHYGDNLDRIDWKSLHGKIEFDSLHVAGAVPPLTPASDLRFSHNDSRTGIGRTVPVEVIPEPTTLSLVAIGVLFLFRRRK